MEKQIAKNGDFQLDATNNRIINQHATAGMITREVEFGVIRLMSEEHDREISYQTAKKLLAIPDTFKGTVKIQELKIACPRSQIVKIGLGQKTIREKTELGNLPTESMLLEIERDENGEFRRFDETQKRSGEKSFKYIDAEVHFKEQNGKKIYFLKPDQIKKAVFINAVLYIAPNHYSYSVFGITNYGEKVNMEIGRK